MVGTLTDEECEVLAGLDPLFLPVVLDHRRACLQAHIPWIADSGRRSRSYQKLLHDRPDLFPGSLAVNPGESMHELGFALDIEGERTTLQRMIFGRLAQERGLQWGGTFKPKPDWNHVESPLPRTTVAAYVRVRMEAAT